MGCKNTKIHVLPQLITFDELPVEIIYKILNELDICSIFQSLFHVCKHLDEILSSYNEYHLNLKTISLKTFHFISSHIRPEQITQLTLSDDETSVGLVELFLSKYSMSTLVRLRSLTLIQIQNEELINQILIPIADHSTLLNFTSIRIINDDESYTDTFIALLMSILSKPTLQKAYLDLSYDRTTSNPLPWSEQCSIRHLTCIGTCTLNFIRNTFKHALQLETFITDDFDFSDENDLNQSSNNQETDDDDDDEDSDDSDDSEEVAIELPANNNENQVPKKEKFTSIESTNCLKSLTLNFCTFNMLKLEWILQEIPTLKQFSLITTNGYDDETILDGHRWEILVSHIEKFQFIFSVTLSDSSSWNIDTCLTTFQKPFWIEQKQWFIALEKYDDAVLLYTLPYADINYIMKTEITSFEYRSTAMKNSLLQIQTMKNVRDLYIDTSESIKSLLENPNVPRFYNIKHLILHGKWSKSKTFLSDIQTLVDFNSIEELTRNESIPTSDFSILLNLLSNLQTIRTTTNLLDALNAAKICYTNCLREFIVDSNYHEDQRTVHIEPFCAMFPRVQHLNIPIDSVESCQYALDQLHQDLINVIFQIPTLDTSSDIDDTDDDDDDEDESEEEDDDNSTINLFTEWIKELPQKYTCHRKQQYLHISLK
ncbi:unnamed protein product [Adineta steineri]|uniref:F-box domain-containing protein n=1 Tax=Adineta steineri TaxID=433720 RepID=A0A816EZC2_9BILA|nr:unnamed protein product [Adineta steineri]CAF1656099.1 unnamed protein product [Adineta steineri]